MNFERENILLIFTFFGDYKIVLQIYRMHSKVYILGWQDY